jgi:poly-gamma-glutamate capsule biosynthesis protein CapA/YwtB (metallophosphatase superfamily)
MERVELFLYFSVEKSGLSSIIGTMIRQLNAISTLLAIIGLLVSVGACVTEFTENEESTGDFMELENSFRFSFGEIKIRVEGRVMSEDGVPLSGASVRLGEHDAVTDGAGQFSFDGIGRLNRLMTVTAEGYRDEIIAVHLYRPESVERVHLQPVLLSPAAPGEVRFLFSGDTAFARRFLDTKELTPRDKMPSDDPDALIQVSDPLPGTKAVLQFVRPYFQEADFSSVNFETPVTLDPSTPHLTKPYAYFTLPGSLPALTWLGVDYITLGNNHVYDYLQKGMSDTLKYLESEGIPYSGAGLTSADAFEGYRTVLKSSGYSLMGMTSILGKEHEYSYVADETKGGAADLSLREELKTAIRKELTAGYIPIVQAHGGTEYSYEPIGYIKRSLEYLAENGASLILSHHPHVAQGVGIHNGAVIVYGLGNFAFDQDRLETLFGVLARVDMEGATVRRLRMLPVYLEDYRPRPVGGRLAALMIRRLGEFSGAGVKLYPYNGQGWVSFENDDGSDAVEIIRIVETDVTVSASGVAVVDLRELATGEESLSSLSFSPSGITVQMGRDIMWYGDFEDYDTDSETLDTVRWDVTNQSVFPSVRYSYRGAVAVAAIRSMTNVNDSVIPFRNRIRVMGDELNLPNKALTFYGYWKAEDAGRVSIVARFMASVDDAKFGEEEIFSSTDGNHDWQALTADIHMPADIPGVVDPTTRNPRAIRLFIHHSPPDRDSGIVVFDETAVINWEEILSGNAVISTPHARDFLRIFASPGTVRLNLTFSSFRPNGSAAGNSFD